MNGKADHRLGRGLDALFSDDESALGGVITMDVEQLVPGQFQPRSHFDEDALLNLAASIKTHGVLQPLLVRPLADQAEKFEIIAGERRWRAAQEAGLETVPVILQDLDDQATLEIALIENLQRQDLGPIEEARAYKRLIDEFGHTQQELAKRLGKSRSHLANMMRLLNLPEDVQQMLADGHLSAGHARALVASENASEFARQILEDKLSVRQTESLISNNKNKSKKVVSRETSGPKAKDDDIIALEQELSSLLGLNTEIRLKGQGGQLIITYKTLDELDATLQFLSQAAGS